MAQGILLSRWQMNGLAIILASALASGGQEPFRPLEIPEDAVSVFQRSGGFAGVEDHWAIFADGRVVGPNLEAKVEPSEVQGLLETVLELDFFFLDPSYIPEDTCCDRFFYSVFVRTDRQEKVITTMDAAPHPTELKEIIGLVQGFLARVHSNRPRAPAAPALQFSQH